MGFFGWISSSTNTPPIWPRELQQKPTVRMQIGPCRNTKPNYTCPCTAGECVSETGTLDITAPCITCDHPLSRHDVYNEDEGNEVSLPPRLPGSPHKNLRLRYTEIYKKISPREGTVHGLAELLQEHRVVHVRGTPASGKTILSRLLLGHLSQTDIVIRIETWDYQKSADVYLAEVCRQHGLTETQPWEIPTSPFIFIIDEAQRTYVDPSLWYGLTKGLIGQSAGPCFCLFSVYGSPRNGAVDYPIGTTPPVLSKTQRISLTKSNNPASPRLCLFYDFDEYEDVVRRFHLREGIEFTLSTDLKAYIYALTDGHPGMVDEILVYLKKYHRFELKRQSITEVTLSHARDELDDDHKFFMHLQDAPAGRSLPSRENNRGSVEPGVVEVLLTVLRDGTTLFDHGNQDMWSCLKRGWVQNEEHEFGQWKCFFPSRVHARFVEFYYNRYWPQPFPVGDYQNLRTFCRSVLQRFSASMLRSTQQGQRIGPSGKLRPSEASFQDEFYRCYWLEVTTGAGICSEWSATNEGRIDFHIPEPGWGVELLRDGDKIQDHLDRFQPSGAYYSWIKGRKLKDYIVLDCRHSYPRKEYPNEPRLWRVVFQNDYSQMHILDCRNQEVLPAFALANR